ncbi:MAG: hypothetical protein J6Y85_03635 [Alphaproteobacteria bacterium]|nr:hypothetical protein [Alphaproteobacteria bacterium]
MEAAAAASVITNLASTYFSLDNLRMQKKATKAANKAENYQAKLNQQNIENTLAEHQRKSRNLLAQQQSAYRAKLGASNLSQSSGSGQVVLNTMQKEHDMEDKYVQGQANISLEALKNSIERINTQNLLRLKMLTNDQGMAVTNSISNLSRSMIE